MSGLLPPLDRRAAALIVEAETPERAYRVTVRPGMGARDPLGLMVQFYGRGDWCEPGAPHYVTGLRAASEKGARWLREGRAI